MRLRTSSHRVPSLLNNASLRGGFGHPAFSPLRKPGPCAGLSLLGASPVA